MQWSEEAAASVYSTEGAQGESMGYRSPEGAPPIVPRGTAPGGKGGFGGASQVPSLDQLADEVCVGCCSALHHLCGSSILCVCVES